MKLPFFPLVTLIFLPFACLLPTKDETAISGTYVRVLHTEINVLHDTLIISPVNDQQSDSYQITQRSSTHFKKKEDSGFNKNDIHDLIGTYEKKNRLMRTPDPGIVYAFDPKKGTVTINGIRYQKIE